MKKDLCSCLTDRSQEICRCQEEGGNGAPRAAAAKVIDFQQRSSELRIKGIVSSVVSQFEATKCLAFGLIHLRGDGVPRDLVKAAKLLETAAQGGVPQAKHELAKLHLEGALAVCDWEYALTLLESAAEDDYLPSLTYLAELHIFGKKCPKDLDKALNLLYRAAGDNDPAVMYYLAYIYDTDPQHKNAFEAAYWYRRAAEHGHFKSQIRLASLYATGAGVPRCPDTADAFLEVALESATEQDPRFLVWQGERFAGRPETTFLARALIKAAADMQHTPAQRLMLQHGWRAGNA